MKCKFCNTEMDYLESEGIGYHEQHTFSCPNCSAEVTVFEKWLNPTEPINCIECKHCRPYYYNAQMLLICVKAKKQPVIIGHYTKTIIT